MSEDPSVFDRLPPHDLSAEKAMLGSMMLADATLLAAIRVEAGRADLFQADHQIIYDAVCRVADKCAAIDALLVADDLRTSQLLEEVGGMAYLGTIISAVPSAVHGPHYAKIVREKAKLRGLLSAANEVSRRVYAATNAEEPANAIAQSAMTTLAHVLGQGAETKYRSMRDVLDVVIADADKKNDSPLLMTGIEALDKETGGFEQTNMIILAGATSMGKSLLAKQMVFQMSAAGIPCAIISGEEPYRKIGRNALAFASGIDNRKIRNRTLDKPEWTEVMKAYSALVGIPLFICDRARKVDDIHSVASLLVAREGVKVLVIDHLGRVQAHGRDDYERAKAASQFASDLHKELGVAGIVVCQFNRELSKRTDHRPKMSDLRDSGTIEQDADGVLLLHREDYWHQEDPGYRPSREVEICIAKWRDGPRGKVVKLKSNMPAQRFEAAGIEQRYYGGTEAGSYDE